MKKRIIIVLLVLGLFLTGCTSTKTSSSTGTSSEETTYDNDIEIIYDTEPEPIEVGEEGEKEITVVINDLSGTPLTQTITTEAGDLLTALEESGVASGLEDDPGYIVTVNGYTADIDRGEYWMISRNGIFLSDSADRTPIEDGDTINFDLQSFIRQ